MVHRIACPCFMSMMHAMLYVPPCCSPCFSILLQVQYLLHIHSACPCRVFCMAMLNVCAPCPCCMSSLHLSACLCCTSMLMSMMHVHAARPFCMYHLHVLAACPCCNSRLYIHAASSCCDVPATYPCCMCF
jgi:hypothetical protein